MPPANLSGTSALQLQADPQLYCKVMLHLGLRFARRSSLRSLEIEPITYYEYTRVMRNLAAASMCLLAVVAAGETAGESSAKSDNLHQNGIIQGNGNVT